MALIVDGAFVMRYHQFNFASDSDIFHTEFQSRTVQVSYNTIVFYDIEHVQLCVWNVRFANSFDFLSPFEENCCRITSKLTASIIFKCFKKLKKVEDTNRSLKVVNCKYYWTRMTLKRKNTLWIN